MENFDDMENKSYNKGKEYRYTTSDHLKYFFRLAIFGFKLTFIMLQEIFQNLINPPKSKDIRGQLALVTGEAILQLLSTTHT